MRLYAQGTIAGIALDETTGGALPCIDVSLDGTVREQLTQSVADSHAVFERTVRKFIHSTAFEPGHRDHQPVCDLVLQRFSFKVLKP